MPNTLYYGDNLDILRRYVDDESVDLVYLDPPFNSKATYNVLFKGMDGADAAAQIDAFDDFWHWDETAGEAYFEQDQGDHWEAAEAMRPSGCIHLGGRQVLVRTFIRDSEPGAFTVRPSTIQGLEVRPLAV
jgi:hypothetical protein